VAPSRWLLGSVLGVWAGALAVNRSLRDVDGESMVPTLSPGDRVVALPTTFVPVRRGDVVLVRDPRRPDRVTIKRVVGLPGETVEVRGGRLLLDGVPHLEGYASARVGEAAEVLGPEAYFVMGDNRAASTDSRRYGPVPADHVTAVVTAVVRPRLDVGLRAEPWPLAPAEHAR
jgi:signal peptidase I